MNTTVLVGAGGHGRELWWIAQACDLRITGFVDDGTPDQTALDRIEALGAALLGHPDEMPEPVRYVAAIGASGPRRRVSERLERQGWTPVGLCHPDALIGHEVTIRAGAVVFPRCLVTTNVHVGRHTHLNAGVVVQHDSVLGDYVTLSPGVYVNGDVTIGDDVFVGTGAIITRGVTIGAGARIGAGAVVLSDVMPGELVVGAPARPR